jgi:hypothetical protein
MDFYVFWNKEKKDKTCRNNTWLTDDDQVDKEYLKAGRNHPP